MSHRALLSPPDPRAVHRTVELPIALLGALLAHPALLYVDDAVRHTERVRGGWGWVAVALCTALFSILHFRITSRGKTPGSVFTRCAVLGIVLGPLNSGLSLAVVTAMHEGLAPSIVGVFLMGMVFGCVAGGVLGLLFGLAYSPLAMAASRHRELPTHAAPEKARAVAGVLVLAASVFHHAMLPDDFGFEILGVGIGAVMLGVASYRLVRLELFLRAVRRGADPAWSLTEARDPADAAGLHLIHGEGRSERILYRATADQRTTPYRAQEQWLPVARLAG